MFKRILNTVAIIAFSSMGYAQSELSQDMYFPTDVSDSHLFILNPAAATVTTMTGQAVLLRRYKGSKLNMDFGNGDFDQEISEKEESMGASLLLDAGSGLAIGFSLERRFREITGKDSRSTNEQEEDYQTDAINAKAVVELADGFYIGVLLRHIDLQNHVLGNYFTGNQPIRYRGSLFGGGAGGKLSFGHLDFGMTYFPPLKGKTEISSEEKLIAIPGVSETSAVFRHPMVHLGISSMKRLYKEDDRYEQTSFPDDDTSLEPMGLDHDGSFIFFTDGLSLGATIPIDGASRLKISVSKKNYEMNFSPEDNLPKEDSGNEKFSGNSYSLFYYRKQSGLEFSAGATSQSRGHDASFGNTSVSFESQSTTFYGMVAKPL